MAEGPLRTIRAGDLGASHVGQSVRVAGWVHGRRDHGGIIFVDVRDGSGLVQVVVDPQRHPGGQELRSEYCISVEGSVRHRPEGTTNPDLATGEIEIDATELIILSAADLLPFQLDDRTEVDELRRLEFRYLDLRRPRMAANLRARSTMIKAMRTVLDDLGFLEVETPTLIRSTPEGARDFVVPSRLRKGEFYALPQSPQLFKQLLMVGGVERYYQIAKCYRDEDTRADRQIEFSQLDIEGSFWGQNDVLATIEAVVARVASNVRNVTIETPLPRITFADAMARYGTDKPDLRFGMEISDLSGVFAGTEFKAFAGVLGSGGAVRGINAGARQLSRAGLDGLVEAAKGYGAKGLVWMVVEEDGSLRSPVAKFLSDAEIGGMKAGLDAAPGDVLLVVADAERVVSEVLGALRLDLGQPAGHDELRFLWVVDFPVFEETASGDLAPAHHPFTAPVDVDEMRDNPSRAVSKSYDLVLNGTELGSGSVRIHDSDVQRQVFDILGISPETAERRFGWFLRALRYGTPPHAGFAIGLDRLLSVLQNEPNIREVIPFPKTQTGFDPMTGSPSPVEDHQLFELGIDLRAEVRAALLDEEAVDSDPEPPGE